jgi:hypothetical protein
VSRTFVSLVAATMQQAGNLLFRERCALPTACDATRPYRYLLSLRLEGRCRIGAISTIMKRFGVAPSSAGAISQTLQAIGDLLPNTLSTQANEIHLVVFLRDELFAHGHPILVTVEPHSSALLRVELVETRQWEQWKQPWDCLEENGDHALYLVSAEGRALSKAQKEALKDIVRHPDTYHASAHRLGQDVTRLEAAAYTAIAQEYEAEQNLTRASTTATRTQCRMEPTKARTRAADKIARAATDPSLYPCLLEELRLCNEAGPLRNRHPAAGKMEAALDLLDTLGVTAIRKAVKTIRRLLPEVRTYFEVADSVVATLHELPYDPERLRTLCLAGQWHNALVNAKTAPARQDCAAQETFALEVAAAELGTDAEALKTTVSQQ